MGFCFSANGLCCDFCNADHTTRKYVKKIACPYGYCQAWACCNQCKAEKKHMLSSSTPENKTHKEFCKKASQKHDKKEQQEQDILNEGYFIRCAALSHGVDKVKVIFRNKDDLEKAAFMTHAAYDKIPKEITAKLCDYEISFMAKNTDIFDSEVMGNCGACRGMGVSEISDELSHELENRIDLVMDKIQDESIKAELQSIRDAIPCSCGEDEA